MAIKHYSDKIKFGITLLSRSTTALVAIIFIPIYIRLIGVESYGLIAFFSTLIGALSFLDLGLSTAISRQVSIERAKNSNWKKTKDLVFSVEIIYWSIAILVGLIIVFLSPMISHYWIKAEELTELTLKRSILLMGIVFIFQFPISIYNGIMIGLEKQILNAILTMVFSLTKAAGVILALKLINSSVEVYFFWQAIITLLFVFLLRHLTWSVFPRVKESAIFSLEQLKKIWRFAVGVTGISIITFFISQIDKIMVSKLVTLEYVRYYSLAFLIAGVLNQLVSPIQPIVFPQFSAFFAVNDVDSALKLYHKACRWVAIIVFPIASLLIVFPGDIILLWSGNPTLTINTVRITQVCVIGTVLNCMMWTPYLFLLAKGNTRFTIIQNIIAATVIFPLLYILTKRYGIIGASYAWLILNMGYVLISLPIFHYYFLKGQLIIWFKNDIALPLVTSGILISTARWIQIKYDIEITGLNVSALLFTIMTMYVFIIPELRMILYGLFGKR